MRSLDKAHPIPNEMIATRTGSPLRPAQPVLAGLAVVFCGTLFAVAVTWMTLNAEREGRLADGNPAVYFTPGDPTTKAVVEQLNEAKRTVRVQAYSSLPRRSRRHWWRRRSVASM
jgi:hypothetical protein